ncbi:hypothetical protein HN247_18805, partial [Acinetobacter baumannii]|uniref:putative T7SS-secreted protein n=1 Tax=Acinetobacter baumannii TaxID=470 RepID=UPI00189B1296
MPGDPDVVQGAGDHYVEVAEAISLAARRLREISDQGAMVSKSVDKLREKSTDVADDIERAHQRYAEVGRALRAYAGPLRRAQERADDALSRAVTAQDDLDDARDRLGSASDDLQAARQSD